MSAHGHSSDQTQHQTFWLWVMCLSGVDYFSTLGYQPAIAVEAAGRLAPLATIVLVLVTLGCALPVYAYVAGKSPHGQGSIYMLEQLARGWPGKILVLVMLGFAATDFIITKTLSAADAAEHVISNRYWPISAATVDHRAQMIAITMALLVLLGGVFLRGFAEVIGVAVGIVAVYLLLNAIVIGSGILYLLRHPELLTEWWSAVARGDWRLADPPFRGTSPLALLGCAALLFPKLALGLSGFETGVAVMPLVRGDRMDGPHDLAGRIRNTRKLLATAAIIMSLYLIGSSLVVSTLIHPDAILGPEGGVAMEHGHADAGQSHDAEQPPAKARALAYLAHGEGEHQLSPLFGDAFGTVYDLCTILILWFAGASAMAGLLNLVPLYLPRYGMAPTWARSLPPLVLLFTAVNLLVTWIFEADVSAQSGAYATGVLMLITSAGVAAVIETWRTRTGSWLRRAPWFFMFVTAIFVFTTVVNMLEKPEGMRIAACFIGVLVVSSAVTRVARSTELRFEKFHFADAASEEMWRHIKGLGYHVLVPHRPGERDLIAKEAAIRVDHRLAANIPLVFIEVTLGDASDFFQEPMLRVVKDDDNYVLHVSRCSSVAHALAALALELARSGDSLPPELHFDWSEASVVRGLIGFFLFGEGNVPWVVRDLLRKAEPSDGRRPRVIVG